ncbi:uncharacterized protein PHACADRAFT_162492 [Phanerochaete carnosa HHB-10118-sp]|uniref:Uncharacterized protein n=1 Tax=Phanerochaete carnosa (strain HHB-10118-sp) TaxID=650164 RepID=K5W4N1_PHACS|nr:uncharacterized protein PHACADRAFT_162492 [Phanerochaete carnosa HHB-10118-sp]EKM54115.1 hypothetical protein PHACADRAFT_162492 [Phanerochaete carnosa HHB-10118-sp]
MFKHRFQDKSTWLYYALARRCAATEPTLVCHLARSLIFVRDGVYDVSETHDFQHYHQPCLVLVDKDDTLQGITDALAE